MKLNPPASPSEIQRALREYGGEPDSTFWRTLEKRVANIRARDEAMRSADLAALAVILFFLSALAAAASIYFGLTHERPVQGSNGRGEETQRSHR